MYTMCRSSMYTDTKSAGQSVISNMYKTYIPCVFGDVTIHTADIHMLCTLVNKQIINYSTKTTPLLLHLRLITLNGVRSKVSNYVDIVTPKMQTITNSTAKFKSS